MEALKSTISVKHLLYGLPVFVSAIFAFGNVAFQGKATADKVEKIESHQERFERVVIKHMTKMENKINVKGKTAKDDFESDDMIDDL